MHFRIEHCTVCWGYRDRALSLAESLRKQFGAQVEVVSGTLGQFDVLVDGRLILSRGEGLLARIKPPRLPDVSDVVGAIDRQTSHSEVVGRRSAQEEFRPEDAERFYDRFGPWQDVQFYERKALECVIIHSDFEHASAVFEWGCGTGRLAEHLFRKHLAHNATYLGIDISTRMVQIAARRLAKWAGRATVSRADGTANLSYVQGVFDRFIAAYVLDLLPQSSIQHVLSEAHRLLGPNGKLCLVSSTEGITPVSRMLGSIWKRVHTFDPRLVGGCRPLRVSELLDPALWKIELAYVLCSWGVCSEIVIASVASV